MDLIFNQKEVQHIHNFLCIPRFGVLSNVFFSRLAIGHTALYLEMLHVNICSPSFVRTASPPLMSWVGFVTLSKMMCTKLS